MARRGPPPLPSNVTKLRGTHRPSRTRGEAHPRPIAPAAPDHLDRIGRARWRALSAKLEPLGLLTEIDGDALAVYCEVYSRWRQAQAELRKSGLTMSTPSGYRQQRPEVAIAQRCELLMARYLAEFGMTPSSRSRVSVPEEHEDDEFEEFLNSASKKKG